MTDEYFYSGHRREEAGGWQDVNTGQYMSWSHWGQDNPTSLKNDDCAFVELNRDGKVYNYDCVSEAGNIILGLAGPVFNFFRY